MPEIMIELPAFQNAIGNAQQMMLPLHQLQQLNQVQQNPTNMIKSPSGTTSRNHILTTRIKSESLENNIANHTKENRNTIVIANVTNHTANNTEDQPTELDPLNAESKKSPGNEKSISDMHILTNGICNSDENIYGNILGSPTGKELKMGVDTVSSANDIVVTSEENKQNTVVEESEIVIPLVASKGINDIASALQHTRNQLIMKQQQRDLDDQDGNRAFAGDLAAQLGILVLREKQKQREEQNEEMQRLFELQNINHLPLANANCNPHTISSTHTSPTKNTRHNHSSKHEKPSRHRKKSNPVCSRNGSEISNLSKAASMSELDAPENENIALLNDYVSCSGPKGCSSGNIEVVNSNIDPIVCYRNSSRRRKSKKNRPQYPEVINVISSNANHDFNDDSNITTTAIAPFCGDCATSSISRLNPCICEIDKMGHNDSVTFERNSLHVRQQEEVHNLSSRSCGRIAAEAMSPPYDIGEPITSSCRPNRRNKRPSGSFKEKENFLNCTQHEQQFHYLNTHHQHHHRHRHHHGNSTAIQSSHNHNPYHFQEQQLNHHHHRSHGQLLIDDADILHQCLVSLAGERNVAMLLKRFQQKASQKHAGGSNPLKDPNSPC